jgi:hypothetical protein
MTPLSLSFATEPYSKREPDSIQADRHSLLKTAWFGQVTDSRMLGRAVVNRH